MPRSVPQIFVKLQIGTGEEFRVVSDQILSFSYDDEERRADKLKITVDNRDLSNFDDPVWRKGGKLVVTWGYEGNMTVPRTCVITKVTGFLTLAIEANAESVLMNTVGRCRTFENATRSDVVRQIANENGYDGEFLHIDDTSERFEVIAQSGSTDAQFINRLAAREGFEFYVDYDGFHWHARRLGARPIRRIVYYTDRTGDVLDGVTIKNDITRRPGRVRVRGRNPVTGEDIDEVADNEEDSDRETLSELFEIIDPDTGASTTVERAVAQEETVATSQQTAEAGGAEARARFRRAQQVAVKMTLPIIGDPQIYAKTVIELEGFGQRLSQLYYVKKASHTLGSGGYVTKLELVSDGHGGHSTRSTRARGLSLVQAGAPQRRGGAGGPPSRDETLAQLRALQEEAAASGNTTAIRAAEQAAEAFAAQGFNAAGAIRNAVVQIARLGQATNNAALVESATTAANSLAQGQGQEASTGGRRNEQSAPEGATGEDAEDVAPAPLEPIELVDPDTGGTRIGFQPQGRGGNNTPSEDS